MRSPYLLIATLLVVGACSGSGDSGSTTSAPPPDQTTSTVGPTSNVPDSTSTTTTSSTTTSTTTTTTQPRVTTTTRAGTSTTRGTSSTTSTTSGGTTSAAPRVSITTPSSVVRYQAAYDAGRGNFGAVVQLSAAFTDPGGNPVTIEWYSDLHGFLGSGASIAAWLSVFGDASQPVITAVATNSTGASGRASQQVIVWIPSDT